jgi:hypothetical protein
MTWKNAKIAQIKGKVRKLNKPVQELEAEEIDSKAIKGQRNGWKIEILLWFWFVHEETITESKKEDWKSWEVKILERESERILRILERELLYL